MAQKRMFDKDVIGIDSFLDLPMEAKALYFLLGMEADDEGFINPKKVVRLYGGNEDSIKILILKGFLIPFKSGVVVITDWKRNNYLDKTRVKDTIYQDEKAQIEYDEMTQKYQCLTDVKQMLKQNRIVEYSIEENSIDNIYAHFEQFWKAYPKKVSKQKCLKWFKSNKPNEQLLKTMLEQLERFKKTKEWQKDNGQFIPYPDTWLRNRRWEDEFEVAKIEPEWFNKEQQPDLATDEEQKEMDEFLKDFK